MIKVKVLPETSVLLYHNTPRKIPEKSDLKNYSKLVELKSLIRGFFILESRICYVTDRRDKCYCRSIKFLSFLTSVRT